MRTTDQPDWEGGGAPPEEATDVYFRQCSVLVTVADLAVIAATLTGGGMNPRTGIRMTGEREAAYVLAAATAPFSR